MHVYLQLPIELMTISVHHRQIEWTEITVEVPVDELIIHTKVVGVRGGFRPNGHFERGKVEPICAERIV